MICVLGAVLCVLLYQFVSRVIPPSSNGQGIWQDKSELTAIAGSRVISCYGTKNEMIAAAEKRMQEPIPLITDKAVLPPSGDSRDYMSLAEDYQPNSVLPGSNSYVRREEEIIPEKWDDTRYDARRLVTMTDTVKDLARGYAMTGRKAYAEQALTLTRAWFINGTTRMNPRLSYAHLVPGGPEGQSTGIIETVKLIDVVDALYLLRDCCSKEEWESYQHWFGAYSDWLLTNELGKEADAMDNHYGLWYDAEVCVFAHFAGNEEPVQNILTDVPEKRMAVQIAEDGRLPMELKGARPLDDSLQTLKAYLALARVGEELGINLYDAKSSNGRSLKLAIDYILPYIKGEKTMQDKEPVDGTINAFCLSLHLANRHYKNPAYEK